MDLDIIEQDFKEKVCKEIKLLPQGICRYVVEHPFTFDDGDQYVVILKKVGDEWQLTDEGHTIMHVSYEDIDLGKGGYSEIITNTVSAFCLKNSEGELVLPVPEGQFGDALFSYIQALIKISDIKYLERERVRSLFMEEFTDFLTELVPEDRRQFNYCHPQRDPLRIYPVDCRVQNHRRQLFVFAVTNDTKCQTATAIIYWWERQQVPFDVMAIHENQEELNRRILARFSDVSGKQFSSLQPNKDRIKSYIEEAI